MKLNHLTLKNLIKEETKPEEEAQLINLHAKDEPLDKLLDDFSKRYGLDIEVTGDVSDIKVTAKTRRPLPAPNVLILVLKKLRKEEKIDFDYDDDDKFTIWKLAEEGEPKPSQPKPTRPTRPRRRKPTRTPSSPIRPPSGTGTLMHRYKGGQKLMQTPKEVKLCMAYPTHYKACFQSLIDQGYKPAIKLQKKLGPGYELWTPKPSAEPREFRGAAQHLHDDMLGPGSGNTVKTMIRHQEDLTALSAAFNSITTPWEKKKWGDLAQWLSDEAGCQLCQQWGKKVRSVVPVPKWCTACEAPATGRSLKENVEEKVFSSFPEHQKLFESWNKYLNRE